MAKAQQLPSGSWRVRVYDKQLGKQVSFTSDLPGRAGKNEAELMAREYQLGKRKKKEQGRTVGECIDEYISLKENILSPTTIDVYKRMKRGSLAELCDYSINEITAQDIQMHINKLALRLSPKSIRNAHGLLASVLAVYAPDLRLTTTLPKLQKKIKELPPAEDVLRVLMGTEIELPCLLAMWCSLRVSEVRGAKKSDIRDGVLTIRDTIVTAEREHILKHSTKTKESTRQIRLPDRIISLISALPADQEYLTTLSAHAIYMRFSRLLRDNGVQHISFHDLRHMSASIMALLHIPDKYAMERGGWSTDHVMKTVYTHTFSAERQAVDDRIDKFFDSLYMDIEKQN